MNFQQKLDKIVKKNNSLLCIGLDTDISKIPKHLLTRSDPVMAFNKTIIDVTNDLACCYKANIAFYASLGIRGLKSLQKTISYIHARYTGIPVILDAKRGDIGNTAHMYVKEVFDIFNADAVTVNPYLGFEALEPFLKRRDKGVIILCRTSNSGAADFQDLKINGESLYIKVAKKVVDWNKKYGNCLLVIGATWPKQLAQVRKIAPKMTFLIPGIGAQGGDLENTLKYGLTKQKSGLIISSSRGIIYANNPREEAKKLREAINRCRL